MDLDTFHHLVSPQGQEALAEAQRRQPREVDFLAHFQALSKRYPAELARAALETAILRLEAVAKFPFADKLYLTREAMQQASAYAVAQHRAQRFRSFARVADLGCSVGGDSFGLAQVTDVLGLDLDELRLAMARANLQALGLGERGEFIQADLQGGLPFRQGGENMALFCDPARRAGGRRIFRVEDYLPPLSMVASWQADFPALGVKLSPGVDLDELQGYDAEIEFISLDGELKEAALWFGPLKTTEFRATGRRATLLPGGETLVGPPKTQGPVSPPQAYLYEPDPAVLRAGLVTNLGEMLGAQQLDPQIDYLTADRYIETPFARAWPVLDWMPFQLKRLRAYLRERGIGEVTIKKRGSPLEPDELREALRLSGSAHLTFFLTQVEGNHVVIFAGEEIKKI